MIQIHQQELLKRVPLEAIPEWFWSSQKSYRSCLSRRIETGVRNIIGNILVAAVEIARGLFDNERLALHSEWEVLLTDVPGIGKVHGPVDFVTASVSDGVDMEFLMEELDGTDVQAADPLFIVVEAKRQQTFDSDRAKAQLLAQLRALSIRNKDSRTGALSDGTKWSFWHTHNHEWYIQQYTVKTKSEMHKLLGLLAYLVAGKFPAPESTSSDPIIFIPEN